MTERYSVTDVAAMLDVSRGQVERWIAAGHIQALTIKRRRYVTAEELAGFYTACRLVYPKQCYAPRTVAAMLACKVRRVTHLTDYYNVIAGRTPGNERRFQEPAIEQLRRYAARM